MSEVKLNLIDSQNILSGTIHGSVADSCVAALSAEPETIPELEAALARYIKPTDNQSPFAWFRGNQEIDAVSWDAGLVIIDLAARIVAAESSYSQPQPQGQVDYHDGKQATEISVFYRLPDDWLFVNSVEAYRWACERHRQQRENNPPLDARPILYGTPLLEFIADSGLHELEPIPEQDGDAAREARAQQISDIHAQWLMMTRNDLHGRSPRQVLLEKREFIDSDLDSRSLQWSMQGEGPPCLERESFAYRFAGFGTHEWVLYYELVRHLLWTTADEVPPWPGRAPQISRIPRHTDRASRIAKLEEIKSAWLEQPQGEYDGRVPAIIIDNERKRLPQAMSPAELIIDDDCEICRMSALEAEMGYGPGFWHLDGCNMDEGFAFSSCLTVEEWEAENRQQEEFAREYDARRAEEKRRIGRDEMFDDDFELEWSEGSQRQRAKPDPDMPF